MQQKIVHESEAQRQFVRLQLPAQADINGQRYSVKDLSSGGVGVRDIEGNFKKGDTVPMTLVLPFESFSLDISLTADVQYFDKKLSVLGCRFINLDSGQISILNHVIKAFIAGDVVGGGDILSVVSRENFVSVRKNKATSQEKTTFDTIREFALYGVLSIVALTLAFFIFTNIFQNVFILKSVNGTVITESYDVLAPGNGIFDPSLAEGVRTIAANQVIATLRIPAVNTQTTEQTTEEQPTAPDAFYTIKSPCDCIIAEQFVQKDEYRTEGAQLYRLIPSEAKPSVSTTVPMADAHKIKIGSSANLRIAGTGMEMKGTVTDLQSAEAPQIIDGQDYAVPVSIVHIKPEKTVLADHIGRPVMIEFILE